MYDTLIIGSGPAGMTAALYVARSNLKVGIIEQGVPGGQMNNTFEIENYPGYEHISGPELSMKMYEPLEKFKVDNIYGIVQTIEDKGAVKKVITEDAVYEAKTIILATGAKYRLLGVTGEEEFTSRGVSYCAVCDGAFFRDQDLLVVGGGDSAVEEAIYLTQFAKSVTIIHRRDELRAQKILQDRAFSNPKISFIWDSVVKEIKGDAIKVSGVTIENVKTGDLSERAFGGIFIYVGMNPVSSMVADLGICDKDGWIVTDTQMKTERPGIFAIGDVRQKELRQITTAVGDGAIAGQGVYHYITEHS
ncbi:thioredoxin-disulfide reductase [Streptococcus sp. zg-JUN1979]|uniref:thioredoxin-disulfide reductase n=1 Tax=Streptococcus sp. zg-JUN1979 TaxID=3391450 RepID=UPI0039A4D6A8